MKQETRKILAEVFDDLTSSWEKEKKVAYGDDLVLLGSNSIFDSMDLVNFISDIEVKISDVENKEITLVSETAFSKQRSPFKSMETLGNFIDELLAEGGGE